MSLLVIYKILGLLVNTLTTDDKYPLLNSGNLTKPIQMQRSKKEKNCFYFFFLFFLFLFSNLDHILNNFKKKYAS